MADQQFFGMDSTEFQRLAARGAAEIRGEEYVESKSQNPTHVPTQTTQTSVCQPEASGSGTNKEASWVWAFFEKVEEESKPGHYKCIFIPCKK